MSDPIIKLDLHGMRQEEAIRIIDRALSSASPATYQLHLIHGYHRGTSLRSMIRDLYQSDDRVKKYFKPEGILCEDVGEVRLDDAVPDEWYDAWEWMSGLITFRRDYPGYYEEDVEERGIW